ncbi:threonine dehydratase [Noviherbaspirillum sp. CPCC 100848]|uniref:Threonine dehydratase n=1 Tax=Noviherbaspirillum album TaxID=3080276 RepID=A0ABU6J7R0_9BURK|nr:threonine dehydratase [Noviherbaspirillum sp. CPCC 100848]MEC4719651.1 threonine dehydratase [Noviherbaspirillum sp. CPCC 100848]
MTPSLPTREQLEAAAQIVYRTMPATPQYSWPLLNEALGTEVWVKHENHTPTGAFKVRGGLVYMEALAQRAPNIGGVISATRGNHGQSVGFAARRQGLQATIVVPHGNSREKNAAMRALGVNLVEHGSEFQESREHAIRLAEERRLHMIPSCHPDLVSGVASYWMELFNAQPGLDTVFVPIGQGSGICGAIAARRALGLSTRIIGVVSAHALAYKLSFEQKRKIESPVGTVTADGMACRVPDDWSLEVIMKYADDVVAVSDEEVEAAMRLYYIATHNVAEGAGAAALAAAMQQKDRLAGRKIGVPLCGGNVDHDQFARILTANAGQSPLC